MAPKTFEREAMFVTDCVCINVHMLLVTSVLDRSGTVNKKTKRNPPLDNKIFGFRSLHQKLIRHFYLLRLGIQKRYVMDCQSMLVDCWDTFVQAQMSLLERKQSETKLDSKL